VSIVEWQNTGNNLPRRSPQVSPKRSYLPTKLHYIISEDRNVDRRTLVSGHLLWQHLEQLEVLDFYILRTGRQYSNMYHFIAENLRQKSSVLRRVV
jgi:hypothetical protein